MCDTFGIGGLEMSNLDQDLRQELMEWVLEQAAKTREAAPLRREASEAVTTAVREALRQDLEALRLRLDQTDRTLASLQEAITKLGNVPTALTRLQSDQDALRNQNNSTLNFANAINDSTDGRLKLLESPPTEEGSAADSLSAPKSPAPAAPASKGGLLSWFKAPSHREGDIGRPKTSLTMQIVLGAIVVAVLAFLAFSLMTGKPAEQPDSPAAGPAPAADPANLPPSWEDPGAIAVIEKGWTVIEPAVTADGRTTVEQKVCPADTRCTATSILDLAPGPEQGFALQAAMRQLGTNFSCQATITVDGQIGTRSLTEFEKIVTCSTPNDLPCLSMDPCRPTLPPVVDVSAAWRQPLLRWALWKLGKDRQ